MLLRLQLEFTVLEDEFFGEWVGDRAVWLKLLRFAASE